MLDFSLIAHLVFEPLSYFAIRQKKINSCEFNKTNELILVEYFNAFLFQTGMEIPETVCASPLGMENGQIPNSAIEASSSRSHYHGPEQGRLNNHSKVFFQNNIDYVINPRRFEENWIL